MDGFAEAKCRYDIYAHAAECIEQIGAFRSLASPLESCTQFPDLCNQQPLGALDGGGREGAIEHIFAVLGFGIGEKTETRSVFVETLIQCGFLVPAILVVVDVVIGFGVGKVELTVVSNTW